MKDTFNREINYLRISLTDKCNLKCMYCMPENCENMPADDALSFDDITKVVKSAALLGIRKIRLTGGEPLLRGDILKIIEKIGSILEIDDIALTTNGILLPQMAEGLKNAGLTRVNISLDTLSQEKFSYITRGGDLRKVMAGIESASKYGLSPIKLNTVVIRGFNDDEIMDFVELAKKSPLHVRFIELMPMTDNSFWTNSFIPTDELIKMIGEKETLYPQGEILGNGPAKYYKLENSRGSIGFISPISNHFCDNCNRLRLTSDGKLRLCLHSNNEVDLKEELRKGPTTLELSKLMEFAIKNKPHRHSIANGDAENNRAMNQIGG